MLLAIKMLSVLFLGILALAAVYMYYKDTVALSLVIEDAETTENIYTRDVIYLETSEGLRVTLKEGASYVQATEDASFGNTLFKLRFRSVEDTVHPIRYGEKLTIVYDNEKGQPVTLNHDGDLNTLVNNRDIFFEISGRSGEYVRADVPVLIRTESHNYLRVKGDRIETSASASDATYFIIRHQKGGQLWRDVRTQKNSD